MWSKRVLLAILHLLTVCQTSICSFFTYFNHASFKLFPGLGQNVEFKLLEKYVLVNNIIVSERVPSIILTLEAGKMPL